jgi:Outer membrane protein beta-barrel domain
MNTRPGTTRLIVATVFTAALLTPAAAAAQGTAIAIKGGLNISDFSFDDEHDAQTTDNKKGLIIGVSFRKDFKPKVGLQIEGLYAKVGSKLLFTDDGTNALRVSIDYVQVPVLISFMAAKTDTTRLRLFAGPTFAFKAADDAHLTLTGFESDEDRNLKGFDTGLTFGAEIGIKQFLIDVRYTLGLMNINDDGGSGGDHVKTRQFSIMFGMYIK